MKYLNVILTVIAVFLAAIALRLVQISVLSENANEGNQLLIYSQQSLISSNQRLGIALVDLRKQVEVLSDKVPKK